MPDHPVDKKADPMLYGGPEPAAGLNDVDAAITTRRSVRAFLPDPVPQDMIEHLLGVAARAPSGTNTQPWKVHVLVGAAKDALINTVLAAREVNPKGEGAEYSYYPEKWREPYLSRRRKIGLDLYGLLGLGREDKAGMWAQFGRNYLFFDAPAGLIFAIDADMETGSWLDFGMFLQSFMIAARGHGLDTCPQEAWAEYAQTVKQALAIPADQIVVCGMSLGYADNTKIENELVTEREPADAFTTWHGF